ncbi:hypothetical protein Poly30_05960 [Planctomycetes bacterium Poly30]|uniref:BioF2-like acetyltransferase domain-containing protein n=1 Tax=Saltatorellus ferox TaxID=2528018 RepID=A0A518EM21_9BACT|nr:hypothetical protein Poly30_05960 [Planctomycetes bacterium Poly30]
MERLEYSQFVEARREFDAAVLGSGDLAGSCWLSPWQIAAHDSMNRGGDEPRRHLIYRSEEAWLALIEYEIPGAYLPFESTWMFACPLVGEPAAAADLLLRVIERHRRELRAILVGGVPVGSELHRRLRGLQGADGFGARAEQEGTESCIIDLSEGGIEGWLARRSKNFQRSARRARLPAGADVADGLTLAPDDTYARILDIQQRSHKAAKGEDIFSTPVYRDFYRRLLGDLHASGELRLTFVSQGGVDLAYHFGFTRAHHYRGYQMSFAEEARSLGLGTALQMLHLERAEAEGATRYDMGMLAPYKERWVDRVERSVLVVLQ